MVLGRSENFCIFLVTEPIKKPSETSNESLVETNEIIRPVSTAKPTQQPAKVTTSMIVTQSPTASTTPSTTTQRPPKPITTAQSLTKLTGSRPPAFVTTSHNSSNSEQKDFVCQIGKGQCQASFRGSPWTFRAPPVLLKSSKYVIKIFYLSLLHCWHYAIQKRELCGLRNNHTVGIYFRKTTCFVKKSLF